MTNYEKLISYVPQIYHKENNLKVLKIISKEFDKFEICIKSLEKMYLIDSCTNEYLVYIGENIGVYKTQDQSFNIYRTKIKMKMYTLFFVPLLDNFINFVENVTVYYAENVKEGWQVAPNFESGVLNLDLVVPADASKELITDLEKLYSAGVKVNTDLYVETYAPKSIYGLGMNLNGYGLNTIGISDKRYLFPLDEIRTQLLEGYGFAQYGLVNFPVKTN